MRSYIGLSLRTCYICTALTHAHRGQHQNTKYCVIRFWDRSCPKSDTEPIFPNLSYLVCGADSLPVLAVSSFKLGDHCRYRLFVSDTNC